MIEKIKLVYDSYKSNQEEYILLQKIVNPKLAGVMFSKNPHKAGTMLIEYCEGFSDELMSGKKEGYKVVIDRRTKKIIFKSNNKLDNINEELLNVFLQLEEELKYPIDIEWAFDGNDLWILQVRYQTALDNLYSNSLEQDKDKLSELEYLNLEKNEFSVVLENISRLNASIINELWIDKNVAELAAKMSYCKWNKKYKQNYYQYAFRYLWASSYPLIIPPNKLLNYISIKLFDYNWKEMLSIKKDILSKFEVNKAIDLAKLDNLVLINLLKETIKDWKELEKQALYVFLMSNNASEKISQHYNELKINAYNKEEYAYFSKREYILTEKRNLEIKNNLKENLYIDYSKEMNAAYSNSLKKDILFNRKLLMLREVSKYDSLKLFYLIKEILFKIKENISYGEEFWELELSEVFQVFNSQMREKLLKRVYSINQQIPDFIDDNNLINLSNDEIYQIKKEFFVSNPKSFKGNIIHLNSIDNEIEDKIKNIKHEIIYVEYMTPELIMLLDKYKKKYICSKYGSYLSHPSVLAREYNITCYIGVDLSDKNFIEINHNI